MPHWGPNRDWTPELLGQLIAKQIYLPCLPMFGLRKTTLTSDLRLVIAGLAKISEFIPEPLWRDSISRFAFWDFERTGAGSPIQSWWHWSIQENEGQNSINWGSEFCKFKKIWIRRSIGYEAREDYKDDCQIILKYSRIVVTFFKTQEEKTGSGEMWVQNCRYSELKCLWYIKQEMFIGYLDM